MDSLEPIKRKIYEIRGRRVMLDSDLAELYLVETKNLKRAVKRNMERFPEDFMFQLTKEEYDSLRCQNFTLKDTDNLSTVVLTSQNVILKKGGRGQHSKYLPFAFTREGIAMLSGLLRSEVAVQANISIMRAFFQMQEALLIVSNTQLQLEQIRSEIKQLRTDMNDSLADQNEINELTRVQLDAISDALIELQNQGKEPLALPEIGFAAIQKRREEEKEQ
ncbi:MAG: ORF6N domain-containing protein [Bacteroidales bacterium]|nr:ORF6N domain-containing protein [Bacteroidales bacterium]